MQQQRLGYYESLDGFPALDPTMAVVQPALTVTDVGKIGGQTAQSYTQWVAMHDPDQAESLLPIGQSERADRPSRTSTLTLWREGRLHPAPLSRAAVEKLAASGVKLSQPAQNARRTFNALDFGAVPAGRTESGTAIRAAIQAAIQAGPGTEVVLKPGTYRVKPPAPLRRS